jgi:hypothetical protein
MDREDLVTSGAPDAPSWWAEPGRPGFAPDVASGVAYPWVLAGHVVGAWSIDDPDLPELGPYPGIVGVQTPLAWMDSLELRVGGASGWDGFQGALAKAALDRALPFRVRARTRSTADLTLGSGSDALDGNGLAVGRGDSLSWWRAGTLSWKRGSLGDLGPAGRHHYFVSGEWTRGNHSLRGRLAQAGSAAELVSREAQDASGAGGTLRYGLALRGSEVGLEVGRGYDHHESFGGLLPYSRRDAHQRHAVAEWNRSGGSWGLRLEARDEWVTRVTPFVGETPWTATSLWLAGRVRGSRGPARIEASLGAGRHDASDVTALAPALRMGFGERAWTATLHAERVVAPVWSDLAAGQDAFLQSTWKGGGELAWRDGRRQLAAGWVMGRTLDRALLARFPFEELWLRQGFGRDPEPFDFGLATASADWRGRMVSAHGEVFGLLRDEDAPQATVDPDRGGRLSVETGFSAFAGDLGVKLRGEVAALSGHENPVPGGPWVAGDWTYGLTTSLTLSDAVITMRFRNLENERRILPWTVPATGEGALGGGFEFRLGLAWRLYN